MEALVASAIGVLIAAAVYLLLWGRAYEFMRALLLLSHAANLFVFSMGGIVLGSLPILGEPEAVYPDPLPQAFVLTAIVINFGGHHVHDRLGRARLSAARNRPARVHG
jgi:multicomponent K+:H+ antiporter subunit C